eukprot:TRINITY_DN11150_c0_g1_i1.p1 TRINITY_DN11150_c0_g1~~TRINITY_DN11150_c0_g1_i1.p1  ORF type:complete len:168 (-),score=21.25 TRINITY_DN11150_c0_g1_i1:396-899(-)
MKEYAQIWELGEEASRVLAGLHPQFGYLVIRDFDGAGGSPGNVDGKLMNFVRGAEAVLQQRYPGLQTSRVRLRSSREVDTRGRHHKTSWWADLDCQAPASDKDLKAFIKRYEFGDEATCLLRELQPKLCRLVIRDFRLRGAREGAMHADRLLINFVKGAQASLERHR